VDCRHCPQQGAQGTAHSASRTALLQRTQWCSLWQHRLAGGVVERRGGWRTYVPAGLDGRRANWDCNDGTSCRCGCCTCVLASWDSQPVACAAACQICVLNTDQNRCCLAPVDAVTLKLVPKRKKKKVRDPWYPRRSISLGYEMVRCAVVITQARRLCVLPPDEPHHSC
jgi:hypothetical protein